MLAGAAELLEDEDPPIVLEYNPTSLREHGGLEIVLDIAARYRETVHPRTHEPSCPLAARLGG